jgi:hypothetical protein
MANDQINSLQLLQTTLVALIKQSQYFQDQFNHSTSRLKAVNGVHSLSNYQGRVCFQQSLKQ